MAKIFLAGGISGGSYRTQFVDVFIESNVRGSLVTFASKAEAKHIYEHLLPRAIREYDVILDSGAFTAFSSGKPVEFSKWLEYAVSFREKFTPVCASVNLMQLDIIGDQKASFINYEKAIDANLSCMPILTFGATDDEIDQWLEYGVYSAIGGLVGKKPVLQKKFLDKVFSKVIKLDKIPKIHLLGMVNEWSAMRYPVFSCDSTGWQAAFKYMSDYMKIGYTIANKESKKNKSVDSLIKKQVSTYLSKVSRIEELSNNLWENRGVSFE